MPTLDTAAYASELRVVLGQLVRRLRAEYTFPTSHVAVLSRLDREGSQTASELAAAERVRPQSMAQTLNDLESEGLIARRPHPGDGRRVLIKLTTLGGARLKSDRRRREGWLAGAITSQLSAREQRALFAAIPLMRRIADS